MFLLAKLCISGWLFFLTHADPVVFQKKDLTSEDIEKGVCSVMTCNADNITIPNLRHLESMSIYTIEGLGSKRVVAVISAFQSHMSTDCVETTIGVEGTFASTSAVITVRIADKNACANGMLTCEVKLVTKLEIGIVIEKPIMIHTHTSTDSSALAMTQNFLTEVMVGVESRLSDKLTKSECVTTNFLPHITTCDRTFTSLPREVITMKGGISVLCDTETDGGNWIVFQRRIKGDVDFERNWADYKNGFGDLYGDFWLGNENIYQLTRKNTYKLRIDFKTKSSEYFVEYSKFSISSESDAYKLSLGHHSGGIKDQFSHHNNMKFSTYDRDGDFSNHKHCAKDFHQGWWFRDCHRVSLNGPFNSTEVLDMLWYEVSSATNAIIFTEMKIRPAK